MIFIEFLQGLFVFHLKFYQFLTLIYEEIHFLQYLKVNLFELCLLKHI